MKLSKLVFACRANLEGTTPEDISHFPEVETSLKKESYLGVIGQERALGNDLVQPQGF